MFPVQAVDSNDFEIFEQLGTKEKYWYGGSQFLFKKGREGTGENWAEVVAAELASHLGIPHADYSLSIATIEGVETRGVSTPNFVPDRGRLVLGNELVVGIEKDELGRTTNRDRIHTVSRIYALLSRGNVEPPNGFPPIGREVSAAFVMSGYLMLDALIGNQDRHEENWGLVNVEGSVSLAPSFDHASSLGRNETDRRRRIKLESANPEYGVEGFCLKAHSQVYGRDGQRLKTVEAFISFSDYCDNARVFWLERLAAVRESTFVEILNRVPGDWISVDAKDFAAQMLIANRRRLLNYL